MKNFSQNSVKTALCGVVGSERIFKRVASTVLTLDSFPTSKICPASHSANGQIYGNGYPFSMHAPKLIILTNTERKGKEWIVDEEAAAVVKRIFDLCISGKGPMQIAKILKEDKVLTAKAYYAKKYVSTALC